jgi:four helix bundle protein
MSAEARTGNKKIVSFEDLVAWQRARELTKEIYVLTAQSAFSKDYSLKDQIRRAAVSVMSNVAEGYDRHGLPDFQQFLRIAKGSCAEVRSQLFVALDVGYISEADFREVSALADETSRIISALRLSVQRKREGR